MCVCFGKWVGVCYWHSHWLFDALNPPSFLLFVLDKWLPFSRDVEQSHRFGRGYKTTPKWGIEPPPTPFLAIFDPRGGFMPPRGGFIPPFGEVGLSPQRGGFIPAKGWFIPPNGVVYPPIGSFFLGGGITPLGWFYPPFSVTLSPHWGGGVSSF